MVLRFLIVLGCLDLRICRLDMVVGCDLVCGCISGFLIGGFPGDLAVLVVSVISSFLGFSCFGCLVVGSGWFGCGLCAG